MRNLCVNFFTKLHPFFTYKWGGGIKLFGQTYWPLWYTRVVSQSKEIVPFLGMLWPLFGGLMAGQKFSEAIFNITRPVSLLSDPHFFARVRILPPSWQCQYFPFHVLHQLTLILFTPVGIWDGIMFGSISNCFLCFGIYPRILGEGTQIDWSFLLSSNM